MPTMSALLKNLNDEQLAAVTLPAQHALILAGAGSGKTRVLTTRIAWLVQTGQISPMSVLAVTFTNKAAKEMLTRLSGMLPINTRGMWVGTFHGLCNRFLRAHFRDAGLPQTFSILDTQDQLAAIKRLLKALNVDDEKHPPKTLQYFINGNKEEGLRAKDVAASDEFNRRMVELYGAYDEQCQREGVVDFPELLLRSYELLSRHQLLREHYQHRFQHVLVDEFQDTNTLQYKWLKLLAGKAASMFAVGDDDQSIYAFRGANVGNMSAFEREFKVPNLIRLEQNYRSHGHILAAANQLIRNNDKRLGKELWTDAGDGEQVRVYESLSDGHEAQWMLEEVRSLIAEDFSRKDIAMLYRSNAQSRVLEHALFSAGIAYRVYGGLRFFERAEIKHALAYMRLIENAADDTAFLRVVNFPTRGIGARTLEQLQDTARGQGISLYSAVAFAAGASGAKLAGFVRMIESLRQQANTQALPDLVDNVIESSGLITFYQGEKEGQDRIENLKELVNAAAAYLNEEGLGRDTPADLGVVRQNNDLLDAALAPPDAIDTPNALQITPLAGFLSHASLEAGDNQAQAGQDALQLMTVHAAKGLEFDAVFVSGLEEGLFPHENSVSEAEGLEEERRLMYVAITRARKRLYLSFSQTRMLHGQTRYNMKSRFLEELPDEALKWLTPRTGLPYGGAGGFASQNSNSWGNNYNSYGRAPGAPAFVGRDTDTGRGSSALVNRVFGAKNAASTGYRLGQNVRHAKFGDGVIVNIEGSGTDARVQVNFGASGMKTLALSVAKLETV
jgi:DNA helicase II / ATP-dependent DNA helicase PcrA